MKRNLFKELKEGIIEMSAAQKQNHDSQETRIALLEQSIGHIAQTLLRIESRIDGLEKSLTARIDKIDNRLWQIIFLIASSIIGIAIGKIFHWF